MDTRVDRKADHSKESTRIMFTGNVVGTYLPAMVVYKLQKLYRGWTETPMVVYKVQNLYRGWTEGGSRNATYDVKKSGYFDGATFENGSSNAFYKLHKVMLVPGLDKLHAQ